MMPVSARQAAATTNPASAVIPPIRSVSSNPASVLCLATKAPSRSVTRTGKIVLVLAIVRSAGLRPEAATYGRLCGSLDWYALASGFALDECEHRSDEQGHHRIRDPR